jgi:hypothetical protein
MGIEIGLSRSPDGRWAALSVVVLLALVFAWPQAAIADKGRSGRDRSESGHSDDSHSGRGKSDDSRHSGSSSHGGKGRKDDARTSDDDSEVHGKSIGRTYEGGWRTRIRNGRYEVFDPNGRLVIRRKAKSADYSGF